MFSLIALFLQFRRAAALTVTVPAAPAQPASNDTAQVELPLAA
jgi:hypothetical protein